MVADNVRLQKKNRFSKKCKNLPKRLENPTAAGTKGAERETNLLMTKKKNADGAVTHGPGHNGHMTSREKNVTGPLRRRKRVGVKNQAREVPAPDECRSKKKRGKRDEVGGGTGA